MTSGPSVTLVMSGSDSCIPVTSALGCYVAVCTRAATGSQVRADGIGDIHLGRLCCAVVPPCHLLLVASSPSCPCQGAEPRDGCS